LRFRYIVNPGEEVVPQEKISKHGYVLSMLESGGATDGVGA
jgi:hypothetical protein